MSIRILRALTVIALVAGVASAAHNIGPTTPAARGVLIRLERARSDAKAAYDRANMAAVEEAKQGLEKLKSDVMKRGDLDEANRIAQAVEGLTAANNVRAKESIKLDSRNGDWVNVGAVSRGQNIRISSSGSWCADVTRREKYTFDPAGTDDHDWFGLQARVGEGRIFDVGIERVLKVEQAGELKVKVQGNSPKNNEGSLTVTFSQE